MRYTQRGEPQTHTNTRSCSCPTNRQQTATANKKFKLSYMRECRQRERDVSPVVWASPYKYSVRTLVSTQTANASSVLNTTSKASAKDTHHGQHHCPDSCVCARIRPFVSRAFFFLQIVDIVPIN